MANSRRRGVSLGWPLIAIVTLVVAVVNPTSLLPFFFYGGLTVLVYRVYVGRVRTEILTLYAGYSAVTLALYFIHLVTLPEYIGFSGGGGIGTDDCRFFLQVSGWSLDSLPYHCRGESGKGLNWGRLHPYSVFLLSSSPFAVQHPLDILFANVVGASVLPVFVRGVSTWLTGSRRASRLAFVFAVLCPFTLSNSLVLVRDGWTATLLIGSLAFLIQKRYVWVVALAAVSVFLRAGSGALTIAVLGAVAYVWAVVSARRPVSRLMRALTGVAMIVVVASAAIVALGATFVEQGVELQLFRASFVDAFISQRSSESTLFAILRQPAPIRIPLSFAFFFGSPFLKVDSVIVDGVFVIRQLLSTVLFPVLMLISVPYFVRGGHYAIKRRDWVALAFFGAYVVMLLIISQSSLQLRHKTMVMPMYYVLVGYGAARSLPAGRTLGRFVAGTFVAVQLVFLVRAAL